jgi:hypothetical protein
MQNFTVENYSNDQGEFKNAIKEVLFLIPLQDVSMFENGENYCASYVRNLVSPPKCKRGRNPTLTLTLTREAVSLAP